MLTIITNSLKFQWPHTIKLGSYTCLSPMWGGRLWERGLEKECLIYCYFLSTLVSSQWLKTSASPLFAERHWVKEGQLYWTLLPEHTSLHSSLLRALPGMQDIMWGSRNFLLSDSWTYFRSFITTQPKFLFWEWQGGRAFILGTITNNFLSCFYLSILKLFPSI